MNTRLVGLFGVAALLAAYVGYQEIGSLVPGTGTAGAPAAVAPARPAAVKLNPLEGTDPNSLSAIVEHPLFNPGRLPRPVQAEAPPPPAAPVEEQPPPPPPEPAGPSPEDYKLLGVSAGPDGRIAALRVAATGSVVYLRKGESIDNWSILDIADRSVEIGKPGNGVSFSLFGKADEAQDGDGAPPPEDAGGGGGDQAPQPPLPLPVPQPAPEASSPPDTGG